MPKGQAGRKPASVTSAVFCIALVDAAGNRHSGKAAHVSRTAESFLFDGGYDGGVTDRHGGGRRG